MTADLDHIILTRFNLPSKGAESFIRSRDGWLRDRVVLFERYCLPSVQRQTSRDFHWIVYFDPQSPDWLMKRVQRWTEDGAFTAIFRDEVPHDVLIEDLRSVSGAGRRHLMTSNLDNDDGLADQFVERLQGAAVENPRTALYLTIGLIKNGGRLYRRTDRNNAFCSVRESWDEAVTCWADWHNRLGQQMPVLEMHGEAAWLQVIHDLNVSNRVRGRRVAPAGFHQSFGTMLCDVDNPTLGERTIETIWHVPKRILKESGRAAVKNAAILVGGKDGLDKLKNRLEQVRR